MCANRDSYSLFGVQKKVHNNLLPSDHNAVALQEAAVGQVCRYDVMQDVAACLRMLLTDGRTDDLDALLGAVTQVP